MAKSTKAKVVKKPQPINAAFQNTAELASVELANAEIFVLAAQKVAEKAKKLLHADTFVSYQSTTSEVRLFTSGTKSFTAYHLTDSHWIVGTDPNLTGISGWLDGGHPFSQYAGTWQSVKYPFTGITAHSTVVLNKPGVLYSVKNNSARKNFFLEDWNKELAAQDNRGYLAPKLTVNKMPKFNSSDGPRISGGGNLYYATSDSFTLSRAAVDDVLWAHELELYVQTCIRYRNEKKAEFIAASKALADAKKSAGIKDPVFTDLPGSNSKNSKPAPKGNKGTIGVGDDQRPVIYNLPGAKDIYFRDNDSAIFVTSGNTPRIVKEAKELWTAIDSGASKGMIQSYIVPGATGFDKSSGFFVPADSLKGNRNINLRRYGFQFTYNPSTVTMNYAGAPQVDIGLETSGLDKVPLIGAGVTSSTVSFNLLLNRMNDMKYLDSLMSTSRGKIPFSDVYSHTGNHPDMADERWNINSVYEELTRVRKLGTMYDVEYLLRTLIGYELQSGMRGNVWSSDIGYLGAYPVELHLGKNLRYLVTIDSFELSHTIFTADMVPVFTNLAITCNRLPDYAKKFNETGAVLDGKTIR